MHRDHFGEFVCGYWDLKGLGNLEMAHSNLKLSWNSFFSQMSTNAMRTFTIAIATQIVKILKARIIVLADQNTLATDLIADQKRLLLLLPLPLPLPLQPRPPPADAEAAAAAYGVENWMIMSDQPRISCSRRTHASFSVFFLFLIVLLDALCKAYLAIFRSPNEKKKEEKYDIQFGFNGRSMPEVQTSFCSIGRKSSNL